MTQNKINIRPSSGVYATYKRLSYQPWTAIAEFVDNSTQSYYDHEKKLRLLPNFDKLIIDITYESKGGNKDVLTIKDNAFGMEREDFERAIVLDKPPQNTKGRNEFGMGLKTAACWFGTLWTVESTQYGSDKRYKASIDVNKLEIDKDEEIDLNIFRAKKDDHYTIIKIERLHKKITGSRTVVKVRELLSSIYRQDLRSGKIEISYNGTPLQFKDPEIYEEQLSDGTIEKWKKDISFYINHEGKQLKVKGFIGIRKTASVNDAGFTLLRRGRVIVGGSEKNYRPQELFGQSNSFAYQRMFGELHMDNWPVTQAKDDFDWHNSGLEEIFIQALQEHTKPVRAKAEKIRVRQTIETEDVIKQAVDSLQSAGIIQGATIERPTEDEVSNLAEEAIIGSHGEDEVTDMASDHIEGGSENTSSNTENIQQADVSIQLDNIPEVLESSEDTGLVVHGPGILSTNFEYNNEQYEFYIELESQNPLTQWVYISFQGNNCYRIKLNMKHPFFKPFIDNKDFIRIMVQLVIALALAEIDSKKVSYDGRIDSDAIRMRMNKILESIAMNGGTN